MLNDAALVVAANAIDAAITHIQAHSADPGAAGTANAIGARVASSATVDTDGDLLWTNVPFTGLPANSPIWGFSYWSALTAGTWYGNVARQTGDTAANAAGDYTADSITETSSAS